MKRFGLAICGMGSAGGGLLLAAANNNVLDALLESGVVGIERSSLEALESNLSRFQIAANSYGGAFLEILTDPAGPRVLSGLEEAEETRRLAEVADTYSQLEKIGAFMTLVGRRTAALLADNAGCELHVSTTVTAIDVRDDGMTVSTDRGQTFQARNTALTIGGIEADDLDTGIVGRIRQAGLVRRQLCSNEVLSDLPMLDDVEHVVVLGGSHSAWAVVVGLLGRRPDRRVSVVERRWPAIFYPSREAADLDGYAYDPDEHVCVPSGRVNRFGGLRGPARDMALRVMAGRVPNVLVVNSQDRWDADALVTAGALPAEVLVTSFGYAPRLPRLTRDGAPLELAYAGPGLAVGSTGVVRDVHGDPVPGLFALGLGAGLTPSKEVGGERSYRGRLDGVWLYQHEAGKAVLRSMGLL